MRQSAIRVSESYVIPEAQRAAWASGNHVYGHEQVAPDEIGGPLEFTDWLGRAVDQSNFLGRWTLLYFGYSRCQGSCRTVAPLIAQAARELRSQGLPAKAAFVDIEAQPVSPVRMVNAGDVTHRHARNWPMLFALLELYRTHDGALEVMSGTRAQLARATAAFHVMREHVPPRPGEESLSINHSSMIYVIGPDTFVAGYTYHDAAQDELVGLVTRLNAAERRPIDYAAIRKRYLEGACGTAA